MKLTYLLLLLLVGTALSYRYLTDKQVKLPTIPNAIFYLSQQLLVTQTGANITVYNTSNDQPVQSFLADSQTPEIQIAAQQNKILFTTNKSIIQLQQAKTPETLTMPADEVNWVYRLGAVDNFLISHQMSSLGTNRSINYIDIDHEDQYKTFVHDNFDANLVAGSNVQALSANEYYFVSGGVCNTQAKSNIFYLFKGDKEGTSNVFNFSVPGCSLVYPEQIKLQWDLSSLIFNTNTRWHALTYVLDDNRPKEFTTHVVQATDAAYAEVIRFDTIRLIGKEFLNGALYTADNLLCRITMHSIQNYAKGISQTSILPADVIQTVIEDDETYILGLTATSKSYLFTYFNKTYQAAQALNNPTGRATIEGYFVNNTYVIFKDNNSELVTYDYNTSRWQQSTAGQIIDYCTTDGSVVFTIMQENQASDYFLKAYRVNTTTFDLNQVGSRVVSFAASDLLCLAGNKVLVNPLDTNDPIRVWQFTTTFAIAASQYLNTNFERVYKTQSMIYFTNNNHRSTPIFYDYNLRPFFVQGQVSIPTENVFQVIGTNSDHLLFAVGDDESNVVSLDHYSIVGTEFKYMGTFPLNNMGMGSVGRTIVLPDAGTITLEYPSQNGRKQVSYQLNSAPQFMKGIFEDLEQLSCSFYNQAQFRVNPANKNQTEMIVVNGMGDTPIIQRYVFNGSAYKLGSAPLDLYTNNDLTLELSANTQNILASGIKLTQTLSNTIQIRSVNNLGDVTYEKVYFDLFDKADIQSYILLKNNLFAVIVNKDFDEAADKYTQIQNHPNSGGKVSTGDVGQVKVYAACTKCNFIAVVGTQTNLISLVNIESGVKQRVITANATCSIRLLSLNIDGTLVAYLCEDNRLFVYNTQTESSRQQQNAYTGITQIELLSATDMLISVGDQLHHVTISVKGESTVQRIDNYRDSPSINLDIIRHMQESNAEINKPVINYNAQSYAVVSDPTKVEFSNFQGKTLDTFPLAAGEATAAIAFTPSGYLSILTNTSRLYTITPEACPTNQSNILGYCTCDPSFDTSGGLCRCSAQHIYVNQQCLCEDGKFYVSSTVCQDCSALCSTCTEGGVGGCESYSALFVIMIILIILAVLGIIFGVVWYIRKKKAAEGKTNRDSSDLAGKEPLAGDKDDDQ